MGRVSTGRVIGQDGKPVPYLYRQGLGKYQHQFDGNFSNVLAFADDQSAIEWSVARTVVCKRGHQPSLLLSEVLRSFLKTRKRVGTRRVLYNLGHALVDGFPDTPLDRITEDQWIEFFTNLKPKRATSDVYYYRDRRRLLLRDLYDHVRALPEHKEAGIRNLAADGGAVASTIVVPVEIEEVDLADSEIAPMGSRPPTGEQKSIDEKEGLYFSWANMTRILEHAQALPSTQKPERRTLQILLAFVLGLRVGEICGLELDEVDLEVGTLLVRGTLARGVTERGKYLVVKNYRKNINTQRSHRKTQAKAKKVDPDLLLQIPKAMIPFFRSWLKVRPDNPRWLFPAVKQNRVHEPTSAQRAEHGIHASQAIVKTVLQPLGLWVKGHAMHTFRHSQATLGKEIQEKAGMTMDQQGNIRVAQMMMGQQSVKSAEGYYHTTQTDIISQSNAQLHVSTGLLERVLLTKSPVSLN